MSAKYNKLIEDAFSVSVLRFTASEFIVIKIDTADIKSNIIMKM